MPSYVSLESHSARVQDHPQGKKQHGCNLAGFCQVSHQRGVDPCRSAWRIYRPSAKVPRLSSSTSSCEGWRNGRRGSLGNVAAKATASTQTAEKLTQQEEDEGAQRLGVGNEESWQRRKTSCLVMWGLGLREPSLGARAAEGVRV